jgi:hypothetical protein
LSGKAHIASIVRIKHDDYFTNLPIYLFACMYLACLVGTYSMSINTEAYFCFTFRRPENNPTLKVTEMSPPVIYTLLIADNITQEAAFTIHTGLFIYCTVHLVVLV